MLLEQGTDAFEIAACLTGCPQLFRPDVNSVSRTYDYGIFVYLRVIDQIFLK